VLISAQNFWRVNGVVAHILRPLSALYGVLADWRIARSGLRAPLPTLVIGGLTCGGDGKTPLAILVAKLLTEMGERPAFLTRGYGRSNLTAPPFFVDHKYHNARQVGDEGLLLAREAMTIVGVDRFSAAKLALNAGASVIIMDDGFQSRALAPDLNLLAIDPIYGVGNGLCLPAGPLRAPLASQLARAEICIIINPDKHKRELSFLSKGKIFHAYVDVAKLDCLRLNGRRIIGFAGLARPEKFFSTLRQIGANCVAERAFSDHHFYTDKELVALRNLAERHEALLVTTEKDAARLEKFVIDYDILPIKLILENQKDFVNILTTSLKRARLIRRS
jgi:tetraacyldisaccharide 4'-kinase